ncbi:membrane cofactor protein-like [Polypterus senegalus]|uniref:membrane cofactor protein-like n=1 Tax=Polypterus senegalus TaxID=55291 RepID=UPI001963B20F|nr:membrane cofactor protein-like [Polypterus senegalus]
MVPGPPPPPVPSDHYPRNTAPGASLLDAVSLCSEAPHPPQTSSHGHPWHRHSLASKMPSDGLPLQGKCTSFDTDSTVFLTEEHQSVYEFPDGYNATFKCISGYRPTNNLVTVTCVDSKWTKLKLICERVTCDHPENMMNGKFDNSKKFYFGQKIYAECDKGYVMVGRNYRLCLANGKWDGFNPTCEPVPQTATTSQSTTREAKPTAEVLALPKYPSSTDDSSISDDSTTMENNNFIPNEVADEEEQVYSPGFDSVFIVGVVAVLVLVTIFICVLYIRKKNKKGSYYLPSEEQNFVNGSNGNPDEKVLTPQEKQTWIYVG